MPEWKCEKCGSDTRIMVQAVISAPGCMTHEFSKRNLRRKDVYLMGVLWETQDTLCENPKCRKAVVGYGNYVTNMKKENEELKKKIAEHEAVERALIEMAVEVALGYRVCYDTNKCLQARDNRTADVCHACIIAEARRRNEVKG